MSSFSSPVAILDISVEQSGYLAVLCSDSYTRRLKLRGQDLDSLLENLVAWKDAGQAVVFEAHGSWSADRWFCRVSAVETKTRDIGYSTTWTDIAGVDPYVFVPAYEYAMRRLRINDLHVSIDIKTRVTADGTAAGWMMEREEDEFVVMVSKEKDWMRTLFHEMRHVAQFHHGIMQQDIVHVMGKRKVIMTWKGKPFDKNAIAYADHPWEHDANKAADIMMRDFIGN